MAGRRESHAKILSFSLSERPKEGLRRKTGININKEGSVRNINGKVYVDFFYLGERVREDSGLSWNPKNAKSVREELDKIVVMMRSGDFRFAQVFPESSRREYFQQKETAFQGMKRTPDRTLFKDYVWGWYDLLKGSGRVTARTLLGYKSYVNLYLVPFFGEKAFADLNPRTFERYISWARTQRYRRKVISNKTVNKTLTLLKCIARDAAVEFGWGNTFNPFFGFKKLQERDPYEDIFPFSLEEQSKLIQALPDHWKPYFRFAFASGLRQGEEVGLKPHDIDWQNGMLHIRRAMTRDEDGNRVEGVTKNKYSRRDIRLLPVMREALEDQKKIQEQLASEYFFCTTGGQLIDPANLRRDVWVPAVEKAKVKFREMKQTRHTFATLALSCGESPLWVAKVMGHRDTNMIIRVYGKYVENVGALKDGTAFDGLCQRVTEVVTDDD